MDKVPHPLAVSLGAASKGHYSSWVVPAGSWQAATVSGEFVLAGCTAASGFESAGFCLVVDIPDHEDHFRGAMGETRQVN